MYQVRVYNGLAAKLNFILEEGRPHSAKPRTNARGYLQAVATLVIFSSCFMYVCVLRIERFVVGTITGVHS